MKTTESKYTLVVADLQYSDTEPVSGEPEALRNSLIRITTTAVKVGRCMFLFDTHQDFDSIAQLLQLCRSYNRTALALPVESELHLVSGESTASTLASKFPDLKVYRMLSGPRQ